SQRTPSAYYAHTPHNTRRERWLGPRLRLALLHAAARPLVLVLDARDVRARRDAPERSPLGLPALEQHGRLRRARVMEMPLDEPPQLAVVDGDALDRHELLVHPRSELAGGVVDVRLAARHPGAEIPPVLAEDDDGAVRH